MIPLPKLDGETAVFGLGRSGLACVAALTRAGNKVAAWDDNETPRAEAARLGAKLRDLTTDFGTPSRLIVSPGVPLTHPIIAVAREKNCPIGGDMDLLAMVCATRKRRPQFIGVTGTNGKSTTTALITHVLMEAGIDAQMGGNIGKPVMALNWSRHGGCVFVLELSSYQLELNSHFVTDIGVLTNISPDHLERHGTMENYVAAKEKLFATTPPPLGIFCCEDEESERLARRHEARGARVQRVFGADDPLPPACEALRGAHNDANAALARAVAHALGVADATIDAAFVSFKGLAHRLQPVARHGGLVFVNDSKATNAAATAHALAAYDNIYWVLGGRAKRHGLAGLEGFFEKIRAAYLIGEAAQDFAATLRPHMPCKVSKTLQRAVQQAATQAAKDKLDEATILLSPAAASFDQFADFEERGAAFIAAAQEWQKSKPRKKEVTQ